MNNAETDWSKPTKELPESYREGNRTSFSQLKADPGTPVRFTYWLIVTKDGVEIEMEWDQRMQSRRWRKRKGASDV